MFQRGSFWTDRLAAGRMFDPSTIILDEELSRPYFRRKWLRVFSYAMQHCYMVMGNAAIFAFFLFCALIADAQDVGIAPRRMPGTSKPTCSPGAICFSGTVSEVEEFRHPLNTELE